MKFVLRNKVSRCVWVCVCVCVGVCVCSIKMPFPKFSLIYLKLTSKAETVNFPSKHDDCRWFPFQTVKLVTESFGKFHVLISLLL